MGRKGECEMMAIGVVGNAICSPDVAKVAEEVGEKIAGHKALLICGGLKGVMEAAAKGAKTRGGMTMGILPGFSKAEANRYIDISVVTGMDQGRNIIIARSSDVLIAVGGGFGTLSEIAYALKLNVPVVGIDTWELKRNGKESREIQLVKTPAEAVELAVQLAQKRGA